MSSSFLRTCAPIALAGLLSACAGHAAPTVRAPSPAAPAADSAAPAAAPAAPPAAPPRTSAPVVDVLRLDGSRLVPVRLDYAVAVTSPNPIENAGYFTTISVREGTFNNVPAWVVTTYHTVPNAEVLDSLTLVRGDLTPLHRSLKTGLARVVLEFGADSVRGTLISSSGGVGVTVANRPGLVPGAEMFSVMMPLLPLARGWHRSFEVLNPTANAISTFDVEVTGEEPTTVPAGAFDAWKLTVRTGRGEQTWWVSKLGKRVVRVRATDPAKPGLVVETQLTAVNAPR